MKVGKIELLKGMKIKVMIGIRVFVGEVVEIDEFGNVTIQDVKGNLISFKPRNAKFIATVTNEEYEAIKKRYTQA